MRTKQGATYEKGPAQDVAGLVEEGEAMPHASQSNDKEVDEKSRQRGHGQHRSVMKKEADKSKSKDELSCWEILKYFALFLATVYAVVQVVLNPRQQDGRSQHAGTPVESARLESAEEIPEDTPDPYRLDERPSSPPQDHWPLLSFFLSPDASSAVPVGQSDVETPNESNVPPSPANGLATSLYSATAISSTGHRDPSGLLELAPRPSTTSNAADFVPQRHPDDPRRRYPTKNRRTGMKYTKKTPKK